jgi:hypothetical protein
MGEDIDVTHLETAGNGEKIIYQRWDEGVDWCISQAAQAALF